MRIFLTAIALSAILVGSFGILPVFGQFLEPIVVTTDKLAYDDGDTILISGEVKDLFSGVPVALQIIASNGNLVTIAQLDVSVDKTFNTQVTAGGHEWRTQGTYTILVTYGEILSFVIMTCCLKECLCSSLYPLEKPRSPDKQK